jgi:hypothetical protein
MYCSDVFVPKAETLVFVVFVLRILSNNTEKNDIVNWHLRVQDVTVEHCLF